jgi:hypothetical protein
MEEITMMSMRGLVGLALVAVAVGAAPSAGRASQGCPADTPTDQWLDEARVREIAAERNWSVKLIQPEHGCWEVKGTDAGGKRIEAYLHPTTGEVLRIKD